MDMARNKDFLFQISKEELIYGCMIQSLDNWNTAYLKDSAFVKERDQVRALWGESHPEIANLSLDEVQELQSKVNKLSEYQVAELQTALGNLASMSDFC